MDSETNLVAVLTKALANADYGGGNISNLGFFLYTLLTFAVASTGAAFAAYFKSGETSAAIRANTAAGLESKKDSDKKVDQSAKDVAEVLTKVNGSHCRLEATTLQLEAKVQRLQEELVTANGINALLRGERAGMVDQNVEALKEARAIREMQATKDLAQAAKDDAQLQGMVSPKTHPGPYVAVPLSLLQDLATLGLYLREHDLRSHPSQHSPVEDTNPNPPPENPAS